MPQDPKNPAPLQYPNKSYIPGFSGPETQPGAFRGGPSDNVIYGDPMVEHQWKPMGPITGHYEFITPEDRAAAQSMMGGGDRFANQPGDIDLPSQGKIDPRLKGLIQAKPEGK